jgi:hypothetical protein
VALLPVLAAAGGLHLDEGYDRYWKGQPHRAVSGDRGAWVIYAGARMRLIKVVPKLDVKDFAGKTVPIPRGIRVWRAQIAFQVPRPGSLAGCTLMLEDTAGRTFEAQPEELGQARLPFVGCAPDATSDTASDARTGTGSGQPSRFDTVVYFVMPVSARPAGVRVTLPTELPAYARLTAG